ncbi:MAG: DUF1461 domain-containing protein [Candidatus Woesearchaeota archaeon]
MTSSKIIFKNYIQLLIYILISLSIIFIISFTLILPIFLNFTIQHSLSSFTLEHNIQDSIFTHLNESDIKKAQQQIINYYIFNEELSTEIFSDFEITHYEDVKQILLVSSIVYLLFLIMLVYTLLFQKSLISRNNILKISKISLIILLLCIPCIIFFEYFWRNIFHSLLFQEGTFQILQPQYISYYIYNEQFFLIIVGGILILQILLFCIILLYLKYTKKHKY